MAWLHIWSIVKAELLHHYTNARVCFQRVVFVCVFVCYWKTVTQRCNCFSVTNKQTHKHNALKTDTAPVLRDCRLKLYLNEDDCVGETAGAERRVVQEYVDKPLLIGGFKTHLRLYVLITSADPLRVFVYQDGLLQLAGEKYVTPAEGNLVSDICFIQKINNCNRADTISPRSPPGLENYRERRALLEMTRAVESVPARALLNQTAPGAAIWRSQTKSLNIIGSPP